MTILIPSYEPDERLLTLIRQLQADDIDRPIIIVDDGSGSSFQPIFQAAAQLGCTVLTHARNLGKGRALKTGFSYIQAEGRRDGVICADSDGQHLPEDIRRIAGAVLQHPGHIVLGSRQFTGEVPLRSRFGNAVTRIAYRFTTGSRIQDTQTGLRGYSADMLDWLCSVPGERFEYEMNMLLLAKTENISLVEVPIETVYLERNESSHFHPIADSIRVYKPILKFGCSSAASALLDYGLLLLIHYATGQLLLAVVIARIFSALLNFVMNRRLVFQSSKQAILASAVKYFALVLIILVLNYGLIYTFYRIAGLPLLAAKLLTEGLLFAFSYWAQRKFVY
ncbi:bifunctional glycosyltransferase family 2/GtrA family protein [Paenibacillus xylaniclasticus]|uniref:bifunctional glycosyltransferase family 2/GtrA family protein n=1 Tax=Paenibacillus xylaniclasticus TaxID=588083 RepID=UPI000FDA343A|nr:MULTISPECIES: bifunctional glycosyltransferase family 2/GtrA family protein [Paenibacillus]GFN31952.1 glycosyl transferase [Paenibacillus curdlanolyticus]